MRQYQSRFQPNEKQRITVPSGLRHHEQAPVGRAEHRSLKRGSRRGLFESQTVGLGRVPQPPFQARSTGNPQRSGGRDLRVAFSLGAFFWRSKSKVSRPRDELPLKNRASAHETWATAWPASRRCGEASAGHTVQCASLRLHPTDAPYGLTLPDYVLRLTPFRFDR